MCEILEFRIQESEFRMSRIGRRPIVRIGRRPIVRIGWRPIVRIGRRPIVMNRKKVLDFILDSGF